MMAWKYPYRRGHDPADDSVGTHPNTFATKTGTARSSAYMGSPPTTPWDEPGCVVFLVVSHAIHKPPDDGNYV